jgi:hypothetical protein
MINTDGSPGEIFRFGPDARDAPGPDVALVVKSPEFWKRVYCGIDLVSRRWISKTVCSKS